MRLRRLLLACILLLPQALSAELPGQLRFTYLTTGDGLSSSSVSAILQDRDGIIWIATQAGLNRYDGYSFTIYENDPFDRNSLSHNLIQTMYMDDEGILWLGTYGGLNRFDPAAGRFTFFTQQPGDPASLSNDVVVAVTRDAEGRLWAGTLDGLNRLDEETGTFTRYKPDPADDSSLPDKVVRCLETDREGNLWIGTYGGLSRYVPEEDRFVNFASNPGDPAALPSPYVMAIEQDPRDPGLLWLGTWGGGITAFDTRTGRGKTYPLPANEVYTLLYDGRDRLWAGTWGGGLYVFDPETGESVSASGGLSHEVVYSLLEDRSGIIWIGTNGGGINKYVEWENRYRFITSREADPGGLAAGKVTTVYEDYDGAVWIGVYSGGLHRYDPQTGSIVRYAHDPRDPESLSNDIVNRVFRDGRGRLLVGTNDGLNVLDETTGGFRRIYSDGTDGTPPENIVYELFEDSRGDLWLGTNSHGAVRYSHETERYQVYSSNPDIPGSLSDDLVRTITEDSRGTIWIGTNNGLNGLDPATGVITSYYHNVDNPGGLSSDNIRSILEDGKGVLWIATTGGGLNRYNPESGTFSTISRRDGLLSNHLLGLAEGEPGQLWLSTNRGVNVYDTEKGTFRTIDASNGLLSNELTAGILRTRDGTLYIGCVDGLTVIADEKAPDSLFTPPLIITSFDVVGQPRTLSRENGERYGEVVLEHDEPLFSVQVSALDYSAPGRNQYAFRLSGFEEEWNYTGTRNYVRYTNLDPGRYTLRIIGAGSRGNWNETGLAVPVTILPPWWLSLPAFFLYSILTVAFIYLTALQLHNRKLKNEARYEELEGMVRERTAEIEASKKLAEEATRAKSLFLANMSHEIRTPLTGMLGMLSLLSRTRLEESQTALLDHSRIAAESLNQLVSDLLDVETIESGTLKLHEEPFSIGEAVEYVRNLFYERASDQGLSLEVDSAVPASCDFVQGDRNRFIQIISNLVSNAIKYSETGTVRLLLEWSAGSGCIVRVKDTGIGIPEDKLEMIFESFSQVDMGYSKGSKGAGLGLAIVRRLVEAMGGAIRVESRVGEGSTFEVALPFRVAAKPAERCAEPEEAPPEKEAESASILVCEDEGINRLYLGSFLGASGFSVDLAANGREAVEKAAAKAYSLILMDLGMPEMDGLEATAAIRERESSRTPIIALTAHTYEEDIRRCLDAGMDDFVSKPIQESVLLRKIREHLAC